MNKLTPSVQRKVDACGITLENTTDGWWCLDVDDYEINGTECCEYMSPKFWDTLGYDPDDKEQMPSSWLPLIDKADLKLALAMLTKHIESNGVAPYYITTSYKHKDGSNIQVVCRGQLEVDEEGNRIIVGCHQKLSDITNVLALRDIAQRITTKITGTLLMYGSG